ncbi:MAG: hypothetical protein AAF458_22080 [Pseudomonadota bacterium]
MELMDPTVPPPQRGYARAPALTALQGKTIGLLTNGKVNGDVLITETAALFSARHGCEVTPMFSKNNASAPAPDGLLEEIAGQADFLLTAMGD